MILITGSLAFDQIMDFPGQFSDHIMPDKIHLLNISFLVEDLRKSFGGTAGNIAYTLSLLGVSCSVLGVVGTDFLPYKRLLEKNKISTLYIKTVKNLFTSSAFGITDGKDNQIWGFYSGADKLSSTLSIHKVRQRIDFGIIAPHNPKAMLKFAGEYQSKNIPYLFDPGMQLPWLSGGDLQKAFLDAKIIIGNDYEISVMEKKTGIKNIHDLSKNGKVIITTLGDLGSRISSEGKTVSIKCAKATSVCDPTGAGDCYRAGFMAGYSRGFTVKTCGQMGSIAAAYTVEKYGTTTHRFTQKEFEKRYKENFSEKLVL